MLQDYSHDKRMIELLVGPGCRRLGGTRIALLMTLAGRSEEYVPEEEADLTREVTQQAQFYASIGCTTFAEFARHAKVYGK